MKMDNRQKAVAACLLVFLALLQVQCLKLSRDIRALETQLSDLNTQLTAAQARQEETSAALEAALADPAPQEELYRFTPVGLDTATHRLVVEIAQVSNKTGNSNGTLEMLIGGENYGQQRLSGKPGQLPVGQAYVPLDAVGEVVFQQLFDASQQQDPRVFSRFPSVKALLPVQMKYCGVDMVCHDGMFYLAENFAELVDAHGEPATVHDEAYALYRNGRKTAVDRYLDAYQGYNSPCAPGDTFELRYTCTDSLGLSYEFVIRRWDINETGALAHWPVEQDPVITWPE